MGDRIDELAALRADAAAVANAAVQGGLEVDAVESVGAALGRLEAALRARAAREASQGP